MTIMDLINTIEIAFVSGIRTYLSETEHIDIMSDNIFGTLNSEVLEKYVEEHGDKEIALFRCVDGGKLIIWTK